MPTYTQAHRSVRIETPFGPDVLLLKTFRGTENLGTPFQYELILASEDAELDHEKIIGQKVTIAVETAGHAADGSAVTRYFHGFVSRFAQTKYEGKLAEYRATMVPWLWFLTRSANCRIFQNLKVPDILTQVFKDFGFSDIISQLHGNYRTWNYCVQYRETAFQFVSRLMEEEGIYYYFTHEDGKHSLVLCDSAASHQEFPGYAELLYRPASDGVQETLNSWAVQHEVQSDAYATNNFNFTAPNAYSVASSFENRGFGQTKLEQFDYLGEQSEFNQYSAGAPNENDRYSQMRLQELQARFEIYSGESDARGIATGAKFVLKGHPRKTFEKTYLATGTDHHIESNPFETAAEHGREFKYRVKLTALLLSTPFRSPRVTPKPIVHGPQTATVVGPEGEKISTDQYGQVKVQFHWDRLGKNDQNSSCYMRVSQAWAGKNWGDMAIPHVGDEVIVECLEGDPDRPIITGRVYNNANMPPLELPANKAKRIWEDDYGNQLVFDATPGDEHIRLYSPHHNSGINLGRSTSSFTQSNDIKGVVGTQLNGVFGANLAHIFGANVTTVVGSNAAVNVGGNYNANLAQQFNLNLGPQFTYTKGLDLSYGDNDFSKVTSGDVLISSDNRVCVVGGAGQVAPGVPDGTSVMYADEKGIELTSGGSKEVKTPISQTWPKVLAGINMLLPLAAGGMMAATSGYVNAYADNPNSDSKAQDALSAQHGWEAAAGVTEGISLLVMIAIGIWGKSAAVATADNVRHTNDWDARAQLLSHTAVPGLTHSALIQSRKGGVLMSYENADDPTKKATLSLTDAGIVGEVGPTGDIKLNTGQGSIAISPAGVVTIKGTSIKLEGATVDIGGAMTIMGAPPAPPLPDPGVMAALTKLKANDLANRLKWKALEAKEAAARLRECSYIS